MVRRLALAFVLATAACTAYGTADPSPAVADVEKAEPKKTEPTSQTKASTPEPLTCEGIAKLAPAGKFTIAENTLGYDDVALVDVYATENVPTSIPSARVLNLTFTAVPQACMLFTSMVSAHRDTQVNVTIWNKADEDTSPAPAIGPGTYAEPDSHDGGVRVLFGRGRPLLCFRPNETANDSRSEGWNVNGTVTITSRTATEVVGQIDLHDDVGRAFRTSFRAPICNDAPTTGRTCCS